MFPSSFPGSGFFDSPLTLPRSIPEASSELEESYSSADDVPSVGARQSPTMSAAVYEGPSLRLGPFVLAFAWGYSRDVSTLRSEAFCFRRYAPFLDFLSYQGAESLQG